MVRNKFKKVHAFKVTNNTVIGINSLLDSLSSVEKVLKFVLQAVAKASQSEPKTFSVEVKDGSVLELTAIAH